MLFFDNNNNNNKTCAASLKRCEWGLGLPIHIKMLLILMNITCYTPLVFKKGPIGQLYCLAYSPGVPAMPISILPMKYVKFDKGPDLVW